jgi:purine-binding chemotaxis protein CheW
MSAKHKVQVIHFFLKNMRICADLTYINKVLLLPSLEKVPCSPNYIAGLMNMAGVSVPVIDLLLRLGLERNHLYTLETPVLVCQINSQMVGLIVDKIIGLAEIEESTIQMQSEFSDPESSFIASISLDSELSLLLNMPKILSICLILNGREKKEMTV